MSTLLTVTVLRRFTRLSILLVPHKYNNYISLIIFACFPKEKRNQISIWKHSKLSSIYYFFFWRAFFLTLQNLTIHTLHKKFGKGYKLTLSFVKWFSPYIRLKMQRTLFLLSKLPPRLTTTHAGLSLNDVRTYHWVMWLCGTEIKFGYFLTHLTDWNHPLLPGHYFLPYTYDNPPPSPCFFFTISHISSLWSSKWRFWVSLGFVVCSDLVRTK